MQIDPASFHRVNVADTCSVWNILSSSLLYARAKDAKCDFCMTGFVKYECLTKPRKKRSDAELVLIKRLLQEQSEGSFRSHSCEIADLQRIQVLENRKRLGKGELSTIAFAMKIGQAVITDDQKARRLAHDAGHELTQTTPHLFAWLIFTGLLADAEKSKVIDQHVELDGDLSPHFERAYEMALQCRMNSVAR